MRRLKRLLPWIVLIPGVAFSSGGSIAPEAQAALFKKIFLYDRSLEGQTIKVYVVHGPKDAADAEEFTKSFAANGMVPQAVALGGLEKVAKSGELAFLMPEVLTSDSRDLCKRLGLLCVAGSNTAADEGLVGIAVGIKDDGKPLIVVNQPLVRAAGHELSARLLALARVFQ
jgi:hypothetical protein